jgi:hypothetical protein
MKTHVNRHSCSNTRKRYSDRNVMRGQARPGTADGTSISESLARSELVKKVQGISVLFLCGTHILHSVRSDFVLRWGPLVGSCKKKSY